MSVQTTIESIVLNYLMGELGIGDVYMEVPRDDLPDRFVVLEKTGGRRSNHISFATIAIQSYGQTLVDAVELNEEVITAMDDLDDHPSIVHAAYSTDYNFTDTETKRYRYQCVYDITYYSE